jgi:hypothetical protein
MTDSEDQSSKERVEEISVTEVSDQVLQELSGLFGSREGVTVIDPDEHVEPSDDTPTDIIDVAVSAVENDTSHDAELSETETVVIVDPSVEEIRRSEPIDPLLNGMAEDTGTLVVIDDDLDRVVIVDDDRPDPTFEERQRRSRRRERLQKVKWLKLAGVIVASVVVVIALLASPIFAIRSVTIEGNVYTSKEVLVLSLIHI